MEVFFATGPYRKAVLLLGVCTLMAACKGQRHPGAGSRPFDRVTEARLSGFDVWRRCEHSLAPDTVVPKSDCGPLTVPKDLVSIESDGCERPMNSLSDAVRILAYVPACTDAAVAKLEGLPRNAAGLSQLAAAYSIRAQRKDQPSDLIRALDAADQAVEQNPGLTPAIFNRALAEEALGFTSDATRSWDILRQGPKTAWAKEATEHWNRLAREKTLSQATQWRVNEERLAEAARAGDEQAVSILISPYRGAAQRYVEEKLLVAWAAAKKAGNETAANEQLRIAEMIAVSLERLSGERYLREVVSGIRSANPGGLEAMRRGIEAYADGAGQERTLRNAQRWAATYARAEQEFTKANNPLRLMAMINKAAPLTFSGDQETAMRLLASVETEAKHAGYQSIHARVHTGRGYAAMMQGRLLDSVAEYADAEQAFGRIGDRENLCNTLTRQVGNYRLIGNPQLTWREIFKARDCASVILEPQSRHLFLGESALSALELGYPRVALRYQNRAVSMLQNELAHNANDEAAVAQLIGNLSVAYRARAAIHAHLGNERAAQKDLEESLSRLNSKSAGPEAAILNGFRARLAEVEAQTLAGTDRKQAIAAISRGIDLASKTHFSSLMASLLVQRADLYRLDQNQPAELTDLRESVHALRQEEQAMLGAKRLERPAEQMWSSYFARYQETYRRLVQRLVEGGDDAEAFGYAEKARAFEPLYRILQRDDVPADFRARIHDGEPYGLADVTQTLPAGTFLLQYAVMKEQTYVWIIWNGNYRRATLPVGNAQIEKWTSALQRLGRSSDFGGFHDALAAPYAALLREPLAQVAKIKSGSGVSRIVIVPDRAMHGLPFAALRNDSRYVIQDHIVSVAASATLYEFSCAKDRQRKEDKPKAMLLVADPAFDRTLEIARGLSRLPYARVEAGEIERLYDGAIHIDPLLGEQATPEEFLRLARESSIVHISAHGLANPDIPSRSLLLFARSGIDRGAIDAERLLNDLRLEKARLVVLAACSSAGGTPVGPEGLAPLVRPLLIAGTPGIVGTLWNVKESSATAELLIRFHHHYRNGRDAEDALREAQLEMLGDTELARSSAVVWAPFQAIGHASSPFEQPTRR